MEVHSAQFKQRASTALHDESLKAALGNVTKSGFAAKRADAISLVPEWQIIRDEAKSIKDHVLNYLEHYLTLYETRVIENGGQVHWAASPQDAQSIIRTICLKTNAKVVAKGKSMVSEETAINAVLEDSGMDVIETDLGEYIIQLADEPPSHIIAPAIHKTKEQVSELFHENHKQYGLDEKIEDRTALVAEARTVLREKFLAADVGITGANFLIAETGQSATGQHFSNYTSFMSGPRREGERDGPEEFHVVLVDNQRSEMLDSGLHEMLRCIRCGACMNHCPVYGSIGGHSYGWVYPGPMGSVLTPAMVGLEETSDLPHACTLNGRCAEVCPMSIPLPSLLRKHRQETFERHIVGGVSRYALAAWAMVAKRPAVYRRILSMVNATLFLMSGSGKRGVFSKLPFAGAWTASRDLPVPAKKTFMSEYKRR